jgi:hypothetical protein
MTDTRRNAIAALVLALLAAVLLSQDADAQSDTVSANYLLPRCKAFLANEYVTLSATFEQGRCTGLVEGLKYVDSRSCAPKGVTLGQTVRVVVAYIERRPQRMHENFKELALEALREAWPCNSRQ